MRSAFTARGVAALSIEIALSGCYYSLVFRVSSYLFYVSILRGDTLVRLNEGMNIGSWHFDAQDYCDMQHYYFLRMNSLPMFRLVGQL